MHRKKSKNPIQRLVFVALFVATAIGVAPAQADSGLTLVWDSNPVNGSPSPAATVTFVVDRNGTTNLGGPLTGVGAPGDTGYYGITGLQVILKDSAGNSLSAAGCLNEDCPVTSVKLDPVGSDPEVDWAEDQITVLGSGTYFFRHTDYKDTTTSLEIGDVVTISFAEGAWTIPATGSDFRVQGYYLGYKADGTSGYVGMDSSPISNAPPSEDMDLYIRENRLFTGLFLDGLFYDDNRINIEEVEAGYTDDAFDNWGFMSASSSEVFDYDSFSLRVPSLSQCTGSVDGSTYGENVYGGDLSSGQETISFSCPLGSSAEDGVTTTFRSVWSFQGSFWSTKIYAVTDSGTSSYAFSVGGDLGSDDYTELLSSGTANGWNYFVTGGDDGDPILGYRSTSDITVVDDEAAAYSDNDPDGSDEVWIAALTPATITTTESLVYEVQVWFVDYQDGSYDAASSLAYTYAGEDFGFCIGAAERNTTITTNQCETNVVFESNGAVPPLATQHSSSPTSLASAASLIQRDGFDFAGWSTTPSTDDAGAVTYTDGQAYDFSSDLTLYAQWEPSGASLETCDIGQAALDFDRAFEVGDLERVQVEGDDASNLDIGLTPVLGDVFHYFNISNDCGTQIDARVTITESENVLALPEVDGASLNEGENRWMKTRHVSNDVGDSYVEYEIEFLTNLTRAPGSGTPISLQNFALSAYDVDSYQYLEAAGFSSYYLATDSILSATPSGTGTTRFAETLGTSTSNDIDEATISRATLEYSATASLSIRMGQESQGTGGSATYYLDFSTGLDWAGLQGTAQLPPGTERTITPVPYAGPIITNLSDEPVSGAGGAPLVIEGLRLNLVSSISVDGQLLTISSRDVESITCLLPELDAGLKDLNIVWLGGGILKHQGALLVLEPPTVMPTTQKVNAGSFKGYVAVYAKGYEGHRLSAKVGKDWVIVPSIPAAANDLYRHVEFTGAGVDVAVRIYIDRVLVDTINLTTK